MSNASQRYVDLSHTVEHGLITYKGLPAPEIQDYLSREASATHYAPGTEFHIGEIRMVANTGTYVDAPSHRYADGKDLCQLPLSSVADLDGIVVRAAEVRAIDGSRFEGVAVTGKAVLVHTGWAAHWRTERYQFVPSFTSLGSTCSGVRRSEPSAPALAARSASHACEATVALRSRSSVQALAASHPSGHSRSCRMRRAGPITMEK
ncbi:MAG: hypothetical protein GWN84_17290 [Gammaproteobacteria bacterium]|nr:hypothetical protein [Gammaproteobacteria bacterium]NIR84593.1 hypothetical protein [Gammaproteobacteria bacterium]NIR90496.1 hypothetical protein [Gammaproteobacteria bacterium]NIU05644.1 hypothetical protein [Gammaproteobacteria bacterium]NIV52783.1 hypothetical protein [Gammaproteobacteria bacterium]